MPTIQTTTGNVNLRGGSAKTYIFYCPRAGTPQAGMEQIILAGAARHARIGGAVKKTGAFVNDIPAVNGFSLESGGKICSANYEIAEGEIIKVMTQRRSALEGNGPLMQPDITVNRFYRVRTGAAFMTVKTKWFANSRCPVSEGLITGPLEYLTLAQARALGVVTQPAFDRFFGEALAAALITEVVITPAESAVKTVKDAKGQETVVVVKKPARRYFSTGTR